MSKIVSAEPLRRFLVEDSQEEAAAQTPSGGASSFTKTTPPATRRTVPVSSPPRAAGFANISTASSTKPAIFGGTKPVSITSHTSQGPAMASAVSKPAANSGIAKPTAMPSTGGFGGFNVAKVSCLLIHWGRVTHICIGKLIIIVSDNGLSPGRRQAIIWTNAGILLIGPLGTNLNEILIKIHTFSFKEVHLKRSSGKWQPFSLPCWPHSV